MLRPVDSLPTERLSPLHGLLTPRSGEGVSPKHLGPATRRSGAYRDGTRTRWKRAARKLLPQPQGLVCFTTHHGGILMASGFGVCDPVG
jgi:hypothetical protein